MSRYTMTRRTRRTPAGLASPPRPTPPSRLTIRRTVATLVILPLILTGCTPFGISLGGGGGNADGAVGFEGVQDATIQIQSQGTFVSAEGATEEAGRGSGFLISPEGLAVTNNHVVTGAGTLKVWRGGDTTKELNATVLGASECLDLAVIQLQAGSYPFMAWHEGAINTADEVYAAGFPLGDPEFTMTKGIVSKASAGGETPWASLDSVIEHDARIRGGNSGGPLVDPAGTVVGVNYAGWDELDYNYAIHRDEVQAALDDLIAGTDVLSIGINGEALPPDEDGNPLGIWVSSVKSGSAADTAGIEPGDVLERMAGITLGAEGTLADYCDVLRTQGIDATMELSLYRPGDGLYYKGQVNGQPLAAIEAPSASGGSSSGQGTTGEFTTVADDTGALTVEVPAAWTDVSGTGFTDGQNAAWSDVSASTNLEKFFSGWDTGGMTFSASTDAAGRSIQELLDSYTAQDTACTLDNTDAYDDGYYVGQYEYYVNCGGSGSDFIVIAAKSTDNRFAVLVSIVVTPADDPTTVDRIAGSFFAEL